MSTLDLASIIWPDADLGVQPKTPQQIDRTNDIGATLGAFWNFSDRNDSASGRPITIGGAAGDVKTVLNGDGKALSVSGTDALGRALLNALPSVMSPGANNFTFAMQFTLRGTNGYAALARWNSGGSPAGCEWLIGASSQFSGTGMDFEVAVGSNIYDCSIADGWGVGNTYTVYARRNGTTIMLDVYKQIGDAWASNSLTNAGITTINTVGGMTTAVGEIKAGDTYNANLDVLWAGMWTSFLTTEQIYRHQKNPWQVLRGALPGFVMPTTSANNSASPGVGNVALTGYSPSIAQPHSTIPTQGSITLSGHSPSVQQPQTAKPAVGSISLTGYAPSLRQTQAAKPGVGSIALTGYAPTVKQPQTAKPQCGTVALTGYSPSIKQPQAAKPGVGSIAFSGHAPAVTQVANQGVHPTVGSITLSSHAPVVAQTFKQSANPTQGSITLSGHSPSIFQPQTAKPTSGEIGIAGHAPSVNYGTNVHVFPSTGHISLYGHQPEVTYTVSVNTPIKDVWTYSTLSSTLQLKSIISSAVYTESPL